MMPAHSLKEALALAEGILENNEAKITVIPVGVWMFVL